MFNKQKEEDMKHIIKFHFSVLIFSVVCLITTTPILNAQPKETGKEEKSLQLLLEGNSRFASGNFNKKDFAKERVELTKGQHPYAIILCCSDSRVPPELIFDESLGKLFIVRVAGNVVDPVTLGSIEYAAEHLHVKLLVILGHESCGAVKATMEGGEVTSNIAQIVKLIEPAVKKALTQKLEKPAVLDYAIEENVKNQITASLYNSKVLKELIENKELQIAGAVYSLKTGAVKLLNIKIE
jgi:carbonic anhydrase